MTHNVWIRSLIGFSLGLTIELAIAATIETSAQAQFKPPDRGAPRATVGGATRSGYCVSEETPLVALAPSTKLGKFGLTTKSHPSFFVYLPKTRAQSAEFTLKDFNDKDVFRTTIPLSGQSGVVSVDLPASAPPLKVGSYYQWFFNIVCQPGDRLRDDFVTAWVQRIEPDQKVKIALSQATPREQPNIYAQAGIWQDALAALTTQQSSNSKDTSLITDWRRLLQSVGLGQISPQPPIKSLTVGVPKTK